MALLLGSTTARADISAQEVWQGWAGYYADMGQTVTTGSETMQGDTLVILDAVFASNMPEGSFSASIPEIRLRETGDGRVEVTMADTLPIRVLTKPESGEIVDMGMKITQSGLTMMVSGNANDAVYDFSAPQVTMAIDGMSVDDAAVPMTLNATMAGTSGQTHMINAGARQISTDMKIDSIDFNLSAKDPAGKGSFETSGTLSGVAGTSQSHMPDGIDMADMSAALAAGLSMEGNFTFASGKYVVDFNETDQTMHAVTEAATGALHFALSKGGLSYGGGNADSRVSVQTSALPMPIDISVAQSAFDITLPISKDDAPQPFALLVKMVDLEVSDGLWAMFDPQAQLPRDPATLILDLKGSAKLMMDLFDPDQTKTMQAPPGELRALDVAALRLSAAGADLTGSGALTFDNSGPAPKPLGAIDLTLVGGKALIDKLAAMGFVPADQAGFAQMMLGVFGVETGADTYTSKVEFKEDGGIYANGQRVQ